jgi:hypothetical protein
MSTSVLLAPEQVVDTHPRIKEEASVEVLGLEPGLPNGGDEMHEPNYVSLVVILKSLRPHYGTGAAFCWLGIWCRDRGR